MCLIFHGHICPIFDGQQQPIRVGLEMRPQLDLHGPLQQLLCALTE